MLLGALRLNDQRPIINYRPVSKKRSGSNLTANTLEAKPTPNEISLLESLFKNIEKNGLKINTSRVLEVMRKIIFLTRIVDPLIRLYSPTVVIQTCFYNLLSYAISIKCRSLGIPTIDYQHGLQGSESVVYHNWNLQFDSTNRESFLPLPDSFITWTVDERNRITSSWRGSPCVKAFCTENLFYKLTRDSFRASRAKCSATRALIVLAPIEVDPLIFLLVNSLPNVSWLIRPHPSDARPPSNLQKIFSANISHPSWEFSKPSAAIDSDLRVSFVVVTWHSTVFYEALELGIPSIVLNTQIKVPETLASCSSFFQTRELSTLKSIVLRSLMKKSGEIEHNLLEVQTAEEVLSEVTL
jgi:hypothetical protein